MLLCLHCLQKLETLNGLEISLQEVMSEQVQGPWQQAFCTIPETNRIHTDLCPIFSPLAQVILPVPKPLCRHYKLKRFGDR